MADEFELNLEPSPIDTRDWIVETVVPPTSDLRLPKVLDYRDDMLSVRNQGSQGTCSAQTASAMKEWQEKKELRINQYFSPQFVYNQRKNKGTSGMYARDTMQILQKKGICFEASYKYNTLDISITDELLEEAANYKIENYAQVKTIDGLKRALYKNGPCYIAVPVYNRGTEMWKAQKGQTRLGGHAMTIVGYDDNRKHFIIRNSWGRFWGDAGHCYYKYSDWGSHWEIWSTVDADSGNPDPPPEPGICNKLANCTVL